MPDETDGSGDGDVILSPRGGTVLILGKEADREGLSVTDRVTLQDADLRKWMAESVVPAFLWANGLTLAALAVLVVLDEVNIATHLIAPADRIIPRG